MEETPPRIALLSTPKEVTGYYEDRYTCKRYRVDFDITR